MFKSFSFIFCMVVATLTLIGFVLGAKHLMTYATLLWISGALLSAAAIILAFMSLHARRAHHGEAFVQLGLMAVIDLMGGMIFLFVPLADAQVASLMMAITMASGTATALLLNAERSPCTAPSCRNRPHLHVVN